MWCAATRWGGSPVGGPGGAMATPGGKPGGGPWGLLAIGEAVGPRESGQRGLEVGHEWWRDQGRPKNDKITRKLLVKCLD